MTRRIGGYARLALSAVLILCSIATAVLAQTTVTLRDGENGYAGTRDTKIRSTAPTTNYGSTLDIELDGDSDKGGLMYWDLSTIPAGSIVTSVEIIAHVINVSTSQYHIYESKRPWVEDSATWDIFTTGQPWESAGAQGASDIDATILGSFSSGTTGVQSFPLNSAGNAVVQGWVADPPTNLGFVIQNYTPTNGLDLDTREVTTVANRPAISITYYAAGAAIPPTAAFEFDPPTGLPGTEIHFDASSSSDPNNDIVSYGWEFGDGDSGSGVTASHTYDTPGSFEVQLVVTDDDLKSDTTSAILTIGESGPFTFAILGDFGHDGPEEANVAALVDSWSPALIITGGDNNYPDGEASTIEDNIGKYFSNYIYPYVGIHGSTATMNRFYPSLGNHDWHTISCSGDVCSGAHFDYFKLPGNERYFEFVWGDVHFFAVDSDSDEPAGATPTSDQAEWLEERMTASSATWKIVYFHHASYSSSANHGSTTRMQWPFADWGADAVVTGHDHTYERIHQEGIVYFVNGLGGRSIYSPGPPIEGSAIQYNDDYGAMRAMADSVSLTFEFRTWSDSLVDAYALTNDLDLQLTALLEGPYDTGGDSMHVDLDTGVPVGVVDSVDVQLRTGDPTSPPMTIVSERTGLLLPTGSIVDTSGTDLRFEAVPDGEYYITVFHRNHLGIMSAVPVSLTGEEPGTFDFSTTGSAYGPASIKELEAGVWGLYAADADGRRPDHRIRFQPLAHRDKARCNRLPGDRF